MSKPRGWAVATAAVALGAAAVGAGVLTRPTHHPRSPVSVRIGNRSVEVAAGATLVDAERDFRLKPHAGRLLDVDGRVLRSGAFAGRVLLNGRPAPGITTLRPGDRITVVEGIDRREALERTVVHVSDGLASDPQYTLSSAPGEELIVRGAVSHELVATHFRAVGAARVERAVALTFDDGPSPTYTPLVLRLLKRLHVHATFFVIGYLARAYPAIVEEENRLGMTIGNHTYNHPQVPPFAELPPTLVRDEIALTSNVLARLGIRAGLFRPPGGSTSPSVERIASALGERTVLWSVDPTDWEIGSTPREIATRVLAGVRPGSIVELHDGGGDRSATVRALPLIVRGIRHRKLRLVALTPSAQR